MDRELTLIGDPTRIAATQALAALFGELRMDYAFVGEIALHVWLGRQIDPAGPIDVLALVQTDRSRQISKMAPDQGFRIDAAEAERAEELDLLPMTWLGAETPVRVHVLFASNALYGRMVRDGAPVSTPGAPAKVVAAEDLGLLLLVSDVPHAPEMVTRLRLALGEEFDLEGLNRKLVSIGLQGKVLA